MSASHSYRLQISPIILAAAVSLTSCSDTGADYFACQAKAYDFSSKAFGKATTQESMCAFA